MSFVIILYLIFLKILQVSTMFLLNSLSFWDPYQTNCNLKVLNDVFKIHSKKACSSMKVIKCDFSVQFKYLTLSKLSLICIFQICLTYILEIIQKEKWNWKQHLFAWKFLSYIHTLIIFIIKCFSGLNMKSLLILIVEEIM